MKLHPLVIGLVLAGLLSTGVIGQDDSATSSRPNVIAGRCRTTLDIRHAVDDVRIAATERLLGCARDIASRRRLEIISEPQLDQAAVAMDSRMMASLARAVSRTRHPVHRMPCGAGHDAMIVARRMPAAMLLLRSPGGISHHPDESVVEEDVAAALWAGLESRPRGPPSRRSHPARRAPVR